MMDEQSKQPQDKRLPEDTSTGEETTLAHRGETGVATRRALARIEPGQLDHADKIIISGLEVFANHGVYPEERELGQKFVISATLYANLRPAGTNDDLDVSIDYGDACHAIDEYARDHTFKLIEALAEGVAGMLLDRYPALFGVRIKVEKPWAPIGLPLTSAAVEIVRTR